MFEKRIMKPTTYSHDSSGNTSTTAFILITQLQEKINNCIFTHMAKCM